MNETNKRPLSKYAKKTVERAEGIRPKFEFQERTPKSQKHGSLNPDTVRATIGELFPSPETSSGYFFLYTKEGTKIFCGMNIFKRQWGFGTGVTIGWVMTCEVEPGPNRNAPRVTRILNIEPPEEAARP